MKKTITKSDGTIIVYEGSAEEIAAHDAKQDPIQKALEELEKASTQVSGGTFTGSGARTGLKGLGWGSGGVIGMSNQCSDNCFKCNGRPWLGTVPYLSVY